MTMNLLKVQDQLRGVPDAALINYVQNPQPQVPSYLALSELQRREQMRQSYQQEQSQQPESSVAEDLTGAGQGMPQGGLAGLMGAGQGQPQMPPQMQGGPSPYESGLAAMDTGNAIPEQFAGGGMVAFAGGGDVPGYAGGTYIPPVSYDPREAYNQMRQYYKAREAEKKYEPFSMRKLFPGDYEYPDASAYAQKNVQTPYDEAINYYKEAPIGPVDKMKAVSSLEERRRAWIEGQKDPFTQEPPVGSKFNLSGVPTESKKQEEAPKPKQKDTPRPVIAPQVDVTEPSTTTKERSLAEYAKELQDFLGPDTARSAQEERIGKMEAEAQRQKDIAPWMALTEAGLNIAAGSSPHALQNIGAGAIQGVKSYTAAQDKYQNQVEKLNNLRYEIAKADRTEKLAMGKFGADSREAERERAAKAALQREHDKILVQMNREEIAAKKQIAAMRPTKPIMTMDQVLKAKDKIAESEEVAQWQANMIKSKGKNIVNTKEFQVAKQALINQLLQQKMSTASPYAGIEYLGIED